MLTTLSGNFIAILDWTERRNALWWDGQRDGDSRAWGQATQAYQETVRLASIANTAHNTNIARQAYQTSQFSVNRVNNVATGRLPNTYTPYDSNGNPYGYFNSSRQEGKTPSPDAPRVEEVAEENIGYCEKLVQKAQVLYSLYSFAILNQQIFASGNEAAFLRN